MKFIHMADMHFDAPFTMLSENGEIGNKRRLEQREAMKKIIEYIKENKIEYLFIAGDLYEQEYIRKSTIDYINKLFEEIPNTRIYITPGNHDPYILNSFYKQYKWSSNVHIFTNKLEIVEDKNIDIYGYGFNDFYMQNPNYNIEIKNKEKINILITHTDLDGTDKIKPYNPINSNKIKNIGFDYIALGHIHKKSYNDYKEQKVVYPGSTISLGFDELGKHGVILGNIEKRENEAKIKIEFISIDTKEFIEQEVDITHVISEEELIEKINNLEIDENKLYKIILIGKRKFEINKYKIIKYITQPNIIKIKNNTKIYYNIEKISEELSLKGLFAKEILEQIKNPENDEEKIKKLEKAFEIGMEALNK